MKTRMDRINELRSKIAFKQQEIHSIEQEIEDIKKSEPELEEYKNKFTGKIIKLLPEKVDKDYDLVTEFMHIVSVNKYANGILSITIDMFITTCGQNKVTFLTEKQNINMMLSNCNITLLSHEEYVMEFESIINSLRLNNATINAGQQSNCGE